MKPKKIILVVCGILLLIGGILAWQFYKTFFRPNIATQETHIYIETGSDFEKLIENFEENNVVRDIQSFRKAAQYMEFTNVKAGRYKIEPDFGNRELIQKIRLGIQDPLNVRFDNLRLPEQLAGSLAKQLEPDSLEFLELFKDPELAKKHGFDEENFFNMFIPNTYEFYWNTSAEAFVERMHKEYERFWNDSRMKKAEELGMTPNEVSILASIVKGEALHNVEMPKIAGLYINRLRKGILLQADPTVIFAHKDFSIRRVLYKHLTLDSPYNTYKYAGLPPGPIMMPSIQAIDAVLNYESHDYIYMCAKDDFSGYHNFAKTAAEHAVNARKFQQALNARNIMK